jgi:hypothetical protein
MKKFKKYKNINSYSISFYEMLENKLLDTLDNRKVNTK